jgi:hypothetical protein
MFKKFYYYVELFYFLKKAFAVEFTKKIFLMIQNKKIYEHSKKTAFNSPARTLAISRRRRQTLRPR